VGGLLKPHRRVVEPRAQVSQITASNVELKSWLDIAALDDGLLRLNELYAMRARVRMPCLLIYDVSGVGESMLLEKFKRDHARKRANREGQRSLIATQMPPIPVVRSLYGEIVRTLGGNIRPTARFYELEHTALSLLTHANPRTLIVDEFQHLLSCSAREQRAALNMVKFLSDDRVETDAIQTVRLCPVSIVRGQSHWPSIRT
jgi:hypothetical protein